MLLIRRSPNSDSPPSALDLNLKSESADWTSALPERKIPTCSFCATRSIGAKRGRASSDPRAKRLDPAAEAGKGGVERFAEILQEAGAVALNEAIPGAVPHSQDIDGIPERYDGR